MILTGRQIREGRELTGLRRHELALAARIITTVRLAKIEASDDRPDLTAEQAQAVRGALEAAGVEFIGDAVHLRAPPAP